EDDQGSITARNNIFYNNEADYLFGEDRDITTADGEYINNIFVNNDLRDGFVGNHAYTLSNNLFYDNSGWDDNDLAGEGSDNLVEDPLFADAAGGDFRLQDGSPAIGAADDGGILGVTGLPGTSESEPLPEPPDVPDPRSAAVEFDGSNGYVEVRDPSDMAPGESSFTFEFWANISDAAGGWNLPVEWPGGDRVYVGHNVGSGWNFVINSDGSRTDTNADAYIADVTGTWVFCQAVVDRDAGSQTLRVYVAEDNTWHEASVTPEMGETNPTGPLYIPSHPSDYPVEGMVFDVRLWHKVREQTEALADMHQRLSGDEDGLVGYWPLDEGEGETANDLAGDNDGEIVGAEWMSEEIPDLAGLHWEEAATILEDAGFDVNIEYVATGSVPAGEVYSQSPGASETSAPGWFVYLQVESAAESFAPAAPAWLMLLVMAGVLAATCSRMRSRVYAN
ncbi:MAG: LamG-like jellyroll fold domain-containing protein, partial [Candidatus Hydrogenedentota bacterium]